MPNVRIVAPRAQEENGSRVCCGRHEMSPGG
jgi:hypothetical protein